MLFIHVFYVFSHSRPAIFQRCTLFGTVLLCGWHIEWWSCARIQNLGKYCVLLLLKMDKQLMIASHHERVGKYCKYILKHTADYENDI